MHLPVPPCRIRSSMGRLRPLWDLRGHRGWAAARPAGLAIALWLVLAAAAQAAPGDIVLSGSYLLHRIAFDQGYGQFLKTRFGADHVDLRGTQLGLGYQRSPSLTIGLELDALAGSIRYKNLNGVAQTVSIGLQQTLLVLQGRLTEHVTLGAGLGTGTLKRSLYGYSDDNIVVTNLAQNSGIGTESTTGSVVVLDALYEGGGDTLRWMLGARYTLASHTIVASDSRPALDEKGAPVSSNFVLNGLGYYLGLKLIL